MAMNFNTNLGITFLFNGFNINSNKELIIYCVLTIIMGIMTELLKFYRIKMMVETGQGKFVQKITYSLMYFAQIALAYFLMLIAMTFNIWLFIAVIIGFVTGFAICELSDHDISPIRKSTATFQEKEIKNCSVACKCGDIAPLINSKTKRLSATDNCC